MSEISVVYAGPLNPGGTCLRRFDILRTLGPRVFPFDISPRLRPLSSFRRLAESLLFYGPVFRGLNQAFLRVTEEVNPSVVWVDKGFWLWPSSVNRLRRRGFFLVHHNTDALFPRKLSYRWSYQLIRRTLPLFDLYLTSNRRDYEQLLPRRPGRTALTFLGYDKTRFQPGDQERQGIVFVGHHELRSEYYLRALVAGGLPIRVYGAGWSRCRSSPGWAGVVQSDSVSDQEYVRLIQGAKIGLGLVSEINRNETSGRCFEIPACGTFLLAPRTPALQTLYREGHEAEFFDSPSELVSKARHFLENDQERESLARRGRDRCLSSDYSWERYMRDDWARVLEAMPQKRIYTEDRAPCV